MTKLNKGIKYFLYGLTFSILVFTLLQLPIFININNLFLDNLQGEIQPRKEVVVVGIDDKSLSEIGSWPWDRSVFAQVINNITKDKPASIGIDVLFLESRLGDESLIQAIEQGDTPIILGSKLDRGTILKSIFDGKANTYSGFVNFSPDSDGKIRNTQVFENINNKCELSFALALASQYFHINPDKLCNTNSRLPSGDSAFIQGGQVKLRSTSYSLQSNNELTFSYSKERFNTISISDVYNSRLEDNFFKDKIILIGSTALDLRTELNDNFTNIFGQTIPGVEIHANILNSFLEDSFYGSWDSLVMSAGYIIITIVLLYLFFKFKKESTHLAILLAAEIIHFIISIILFNYGILTPIIQASIYILGLYIFSLIYRNVIQKRENLYIKNAFSRYLNPKLLNVLLQNSDKLKLGGETREMSVLFSDIRGFTTISEGMKPQELVNMINDYLSYMTEIILKNNGTIDKYIGDAIMAFWNAPLDDPNHKINAIRTALEMENLVNEFMQLHPEYPEIKIGIGINSGEMTVGNIGGKDRFDYTVLGDNVNLGARLEGLTKKYGVTIVVSETVVDNAQGNSLRDNSIAFRQLDEVRVKGKSDSVKIYEPYLQTSPARPGSNNALIMAGGDIRRQVSEIYEEGFRLYQEGNFKEALKILAKIENDNPAKLLIERIRILKKKPKVDWNWVWTWDEK